ncbi:hypothetical protein [Acetobacter thailandicus]|uniref:hypothetical protein n=1 Tax=Acetobacter thailandicus TaxID=1502842 RepID=UPI001BA6DC79|nr:hypothetical protein [Acetobacter thailandicus]MBS0986057.1 hypothetical protein [Acetobacter thailandicus]
MAQPSAQLTIYTARQLTLLRTRRSDQARILFKKINSELTHAVTSYTQALNALKSHQKAWAETQDRISEQHRGHILKGQHFRQDHETLQRMADQAIRLEEKAAADHKAVENLTLMATQIRHDLMMAEQKEKQAQDFIKKIQENEKKARYNRDEQELSDLVMARHSASQTKERTKKLIMNKLKS